MAEVGIVASVVQLASTGLKLSISLYTFAETVRSADKDVKHIAKDISLTSAVLGELGENLKNDKQHGVASDNAIRVAEEVVHECSELFKDINAALEKGTGKGSGKLSLGRFKWPYLQPKMELLRSNLERLKSTLVLMLHVLSYAARRKRHSSNTSQADVDRQQIQRLMEANQTAIANFEKLSLTIGSSEQSESGYHQDYPKGSPDRPDSRFGSSKAIGISSGSKSARPALPTNDAFRPFNNMRIPSAASGNKSLQAFDHDPPTSSRSNLQIMSSMDITALVRWLQKSGAVVERIDSARTMLSATDISMGDENAVGDTHQIRSDRDEIRLESGGVERQQRSRREHRNRVYYQDANGLLVPAQTTGAGVRRSNSHSDPKTAPIIINNNQWDDSSPERRRISYEGRHYSSSDEFDDRTHSRERHRPRSRPRRRAHRHRSGSVSPSFDPELERKLQRLEALEMREDDDARRRKHEVSMIEEVKKKEKKEEKPKKIQDSTRPTYIKVHRKHVSPDTLDAYDLPWEWDERDSNYMIIKRWIPEHDQDVLFEHTRKLREGRLLTNATVDLKKEKDKLLIVRKKEPVDEVDELLDKWTTLGSNSSRRNKQSELDIHLT